MFKNITLTIFVTFFAITLVSAQETWSLEQAVRYAQQNNLAVKRAQTAIRSTELQLMQDQSNRIPTLNGSASYGYNFGRSIDPTTNSFNSQSIGFNQFSLSTNATIFAGGQINNSIKQSKVLVEASRLDAADAANTLGLDVATAYLNVLLGEEQLATARQQLVLSQANLDQVNRLIRAGSRPENDRYDILAQIARNEQSIIDAENTIANSYLNLKQLMNVDPNLDIRIQRPEITIPAEVNPDGFSLNEVYSTALNTQPQIKANELRLQGSQLGVNVAKAALFPTLSAFGSLDTRYSSQGQVPSGTNLVRIPQQVFIDGNPVTIETDQTIPTFTNNPYFDQLNENFGQAVGLSLNIPILNNFRNRINVQRAQVDILNTEVTNDQARQQLKTNIQTGISNARAGRRSYDAALRSVEANQIAFQNAQRRFDLGAINSLEFTTARNNLDQAQISLIQAKYQYLFNVKVVEFYQGKQISLD